MSGLFQHVQQISDNNLKLKQKNYNKSSMVAISHAIEDIILEFKVPTNLYVTFQKEKKFLAEKEKYKKLDTMCNSISLFADEFSEKTKEGFSDSTNFYDLNSFSENLKSSLKKEWNVIIQHPLFSMALLTLLGASPRGFLIHRELPAQSIPNGRLSRSYALSKGVNSGKPYPNETNLYLILIYLVLKGFYWHLYLYRELLHTYKSKCELIGL